VKKFSAPTVEKVQKLSSSWFQRIKTPEKVFLTCDHELTVAVLTTVLVGGKDKAPRQI
jgi:hypothetical protein